MAGKRLRAETICRFVRVVMREGLDAAGGGTRPGIKDWLAEADT